MGYALEPKGHRIYCMSTMKMILSRDVLIDENSLWDWDLNKVAKSVFQEPVLPGQSTKLNAFDVEGTSDNPVIKTKSLAEVFEKCNITTVEPNNYYDAAKFEDWVTAMKLDSILKNQTWRLTKLPNKKRSIGFKWIFRTIFNPDDSVLKKRPGWF